MDITCFRWRVRIYDCIVRWLDAQITLSTSICIGFVQSETERTLILLLKFFKRVAKVLSYMNLAAEYSMLLEYDATSLGVRIPSFRGNLLSSPSSVARSVKARVFPLNDGYKLSRNKKTSMSLNFGSFLILFSYRLFLFQTAYLVSETGVWGHWNGCSDCAFSFVYKLRYFLN